LKIQDVPSRIQEGSNSYESSLLERQKFMEKLKTELESLTSIAKNIPSSSSSGHTHLCTGIIDPAHYATSNLKVIFTPHQANQISDQKIIISPRSDKQELNTDGSPNKYEIRLFDFDSPDTIKQSAQLNRILKKCQLLAKINDNLQHNSIAVPEYREEIKKINKESSSDPKVYSNEEIVKVLTNLAPKLKALTRMA